MPFLEARISTALRRGSSGGPTGKRTMIYIQAALRHQNAERSYPLQRYTFDFGIAERNKAEEVRSFLYVTQWGAPGGGCYSGFRALDWNDHELTFDNSRLKFIAGSTWQMCRVYSAGAGEYVRPVRKIEIGSASLIRRNRGGLLTLASATVDNNTAIATISGHVAGDTYSASAIFDIPVTFVDDDALAGITLDGNVESILHGLGQVDLIELPVEALA